MTSAGLRLPVIVTLASLAVVGRLALLSMPGVSLSFLVVFVAGVAFGARVGASVGVLGRLASDLLLSGLDPIFLPMAIVEGSLGIVAGLLGHVFDFGQRADARGLLPRALLASLGLLFTLAFSVLADTFTWLFYNWILPSVDDAARAALWGTLVLRGLVFNLPSAIFNAALFSAAVPPILMGLRANGLLTDSTDSPPHREPQDSG